MQPHQAYCLGHKLDEAAHRQDGAYDGKEAHEDTDKNRGEAEGDERDVGEALGGMHAGED